MSRGSEIVIGILCLLLSAVFFILAPITGPTAPIGVSGILLSAAVAGMIGISCVTTWGRPMTSRIAAGCLCLAMLALAVGIMFSNKSEVKAIIFAGTIALMSGVYCCSGLYPSWLPLSRVFSHRDTAQFGGGGNVEVDDRGVSYTDPDGQVSTLAWEELQLIGVETTSAGPFLEDVFFCLEGANTRIAIPQSAEGCKELVNRLTGMEGFDCSAFTKAMCSTHDAFFVCWKKKRPEEPA